MITDNPKQYSVLIFEYANNSWGAHLLDHWLSIESADATMLLTKLHQAIECERKIYEENDLKWEDEVKPAPEKYWTLFANSKPISENPRFVNAHCEKLLGDIVEPRYTEATRELAPA